MKTTGIVLCLSISCLVFLSPVRATDNRYVEEFFTTDYRDQNQTTAWWDTNTGTLRMYPFVPRVVSTYSGSGQGLDIVVAGKYAFVAHGGLGGLTVLDITDPENLSFAGKYDTPGSAMGIAVAGNNAYIADGLNGLVIVNITDPAHPVYAGGCDTPGYARDVVVDGNYAYVADEDEGLQVIDIKNPASPAVTGCYNTPGSAWRVDVSGNYAYVADFALGGLQVIDISDPENPTFSDSYNTNGTAYGVKISGDFAYVSDWHEGLAVIDISDPTDVSFAGGCNPGYIQYIDITGDYAYAVGLAGVYEINISDPSNPAVLDTIPVGNTWGIALAGEYAYLANYTSGIKTIHVCNIRPPLHVGGFDRDGNRPMVLSGNYLWNDIGSDVYAYDISDPANPVPAGTYSVGSGSAGDIFISGDYLFAAAYSGGLEVVDISDPASPFLAGNYATPLIVQSVSVSGDYAYLAGEDSLLAIDISDPANPARGGAVNLHWLCNTVSVTVDGDYAFVCMGNPGICVVDISDPANPDSIGEYSTPGKAMQAVVDGDYLYVVDYYSIVVLDISDPANPAFAGTYDRPGFFNGIALEGDYAFVARGSSGLTVLDISDPANPDSVGNYPAWRDGIYDPSYLGVAVEGDYAFISGWNAGIRVAKVFERMTTEPSARTQSLSINQEIDGIAAVRFSAVQTDSIFWAVSGDSGTCWQDAPLDTWISLDKSAFSLMWRSDLMPSIPFVEPTCSMLQIEWLFHSATIDSIVDVPGDQGGWTYLYFTRSGLDLLTEDTYPVAAYNVHRRVDDPALLGKILELESLPQEKGCGSMAAADPRYVSVDGDQYLVAGQVAGQAPPGVWAIVQTVMADQEDQYVCLVPTCSDSSAEFDYSVYFVSAHTTTPSVYYYSCPDSGYSIDNIAPGVPLGLAVAYNTGSGNELTWDASSEPDFQYYRIYRGTDESFTPGPGNLVQETTSPSWIDPDYDGWDVYYKVTALDYVENESDAATPSSVTGDDNPGLPKTFALYQNVPNPFNPSTIIRFDLPIVGHVRLCVYDVKGELISTLVDRQMIEGHKEVVWSGCDSRGNSVTSGIYFYRLVVGDNVQTRKMVLLR